MKLAKAKELLKELIVGADQDALPDHVDALKLLIEVAKWVELCRVTSPGVVPTLFHGETKE